VAGAKEHPDALRNDLDSFRQSETVRVFRKENRKSGGYEMRFTARDARNAPLEMDLEPKVFFNVVCRDMCDGIAGYFEGVGWFIYSSNVYRITLAAVDTRRDSPS
jgi:hypothetical protein